MPVLIKACMQHLFQETEKNLPIQNEIYVVKIQVETFEKIAKLFPKG